MSSQNIYLDLKNKQIGGSNFFKNAFTKEGLLITTAIGAGSSLLTKSPKESVQPSVQLIVPPSVKSSVPAIQVSPLVKPFVPVIQVIPSVQSSIQSSIPKLSVQPTDNGSQSNLVNIIYLRRAIADYNLEEMNSIIKDIKDIDEAINLSGEPYEDNPTPLVYAMKQYYLKGMELLIQNGAKVDKNNNIGDTALMIAIKENYFEGMKLLIKNGANVNIINKYGESPLTYASKLKNINIKIIELLLQKGANINPEKYFHSPLKEAIFVENLEVIKYLIKNGANINQIDKYDNTPLDYAIHFSNLEVIDFLIKNGAKFTDNMVLRISENKPTDKIVQKIKSLSLDQINAASTGAASTGAVSTGAVSTDAGSTGKRKYLKYKEKYLQLKNQLN